MQRGPSPHSPGVPPPPAPPPPQRRSAAALYGVLFLAGGATMALELSAVRLLAPWFGTSVTVWTNVIGVVLFALSAGYLAGARLARRPAVERLLAWALVLAGAASAWLPAATRPLARAFLPEGVTLDRAADLLLWGSLATSLALFLLPAALLGCVGPLAVEAVGRRRGISAGAAGGRVFAASTIGSLAGTFAATHLLVPRLGLALTFVWIGAALFLPGLVGLFVSRDSRRPFGGALALALVLSPALAPETGPPPIAPGRRLLEVRQSPYQLVRVTESVEEPRLRFLEVDEGFDSFQSVWSPQPGPLGSGFYYDAFALPPWWGGASGPAWRVLVLGLGAGTAWRVLEGALPPGVSLDGTGVEIDPVVVELGRRWMDLESGAGRRVLAGWDARAALAGLAGPFDEIVLDAYANQVEIPPHLATVEFFRAVRARLVSGGWLVVNVGAFGLDDPVLEAVARTAAAAFDREVLAMRIPFSRNAALFARRDAALPAPRTSAWRAAPGELGLLAARSEIPGATRVFPPGEAPLTDDRSPLEQLQRESLRRAAERRRAP